jgi:hypothetical protein
MAFAHPLAFAVAGGVTDWRSGDIEADTLV